ncbi:peptide ABC transporter substrate-binding protein [Chloroflexota bacterium]
MNLRKSLKSLVFGLIMLMLVIASCAPKPADETGTAPTSPGGATGAPTMAPEMTSITIVIPDNPVAFNGINTDTGYEQAMGELVMLSLAETDPNGNVFPELAVDIPTIENGGVIFDDETWSMTVTWTIRDDVYWSDGEQVTVDDVIFTWDMVARDAWTAALDYTDYLEKVDDFTFIVHYYEGYIFPDYRLHFGGEDFFVYAEHYCDSTQNFYEWDCDNQPLSSGPYVLDEWIADDHLTFSRNPYYFEAGKPEIDQVIVKIVPEESVKKTMMLEGDADLHYWPAENNAVEYQLTDNLVNLLISPTERWVMRLVPNHTAKGDRETPHPFLSDVLVRQAIRMAVDVDTIINDIFLGFGNPVWTEIFRPPYNTCNVPKPVYDQAGAAALLTDAGWTDTDGDGIRECNGCPNAAEGTLMSMDFAIYAEYGETLELAQQLIAESLTAIGMDVELLTIEGAILWAPADDGGIEENGMFDLDMWDDGYPGTDPTDFLWTYFYSDSDYNYSNWFNPDFDAWVDELYTLDEADRQEAFCEIAAIYEAELPWILLFSTLELHGVSDRLVGVEPNANDPVTWNVADWTLK